MSIMNNLGAQKELFGDYFFKKIIKKKLLFDSN